MKHLTMVSHVNTILYVDELALNSGHTIIIVIMLSYTEFALIMCKALSYRYQSPLIFMTVLTESSALISALADEETGFMQKEYK